MRRMSKLIALLAGMLAAQIFLTPLAAPRTLTAQAHELLTKAFSDAEGLGSVKFIDTTTTSRGQQILSGQISAKSASETSIIGTTTLIVQLIGDVVYVHGRANNLKSALELDTKEIAAVATRWVAVPSTDSAFASLTSSLQLTKELNLYIPSSGLHLLKARKLKGVKVIPLTGKPTMEIATRQNGSVTLFISAKTHLPVGGTLVAQRGSKVLREVAAFSDWGKPVTIAPPSGAVTIITVLTVT